MHDKISISDVTIIYCKDTSYNDAIDCSYYDHNVKILHTSCVVLLCLNSYCLAFTLTAICTMHLKSMYITPGLPRIS